MRIKSCIPSTEREYCEADVLHREEIVALNSHDVQNFPRHVCIGNGALLIYYCDCDMHMPVGPDGLNVMAVMARMREKRWRDEGHQQEPKKVGSRCRGPSSSYRAEMQRRELTIMETSNSLAALKSVLDSEMAIVSRGTNVDLRLFEGDTEDERRDNMYAELRRADKACREIRAKLTALSTAGGGSASGRDSPWAVK